jgi:hypothetical protein
MEEKRTKLSFSIPSKPTPPKPTAFSSASPQPSPATQFITTFDPSQPLTSPAAVIAPLPN